MEDGDRLHIDRAALREQVGATAMSGLVGTLSCDRFGDCGTGRMNNWLFYPTLGFGHKQQPFKGHREGKFADNVILCKHLGQEN